MARDYAKNSRNKTRSTGRSGARKPSASRRSNNTQAPARVWRWYTFGVGTGVFLSLLLYLVTRPPSPELGDPAVAADSASSTEQKAPPRPRFDFYTLLPEQTIDVDVEPADIAQPRDSSGSSDVYILQAGSFRQRQDADRRRAELLLLGLEPRIEESRADNGRWFRVFIGPYDSRAKMAKARSLTAGQNIDTLLLKRPR